MMNAPSSRIKWSDAAYHVMQTLPDGVPVLARQQIRDMATAIANRARRKVVTGEIVKEAAELIVGKRE